MRVLRSFTGLTLPVKGSDAPTGSVAAEELERHGGPAQAHDPDRAEAGEAGTDPIRRLASARIIVNPAVDRPGEASEDRVLGVPRSTSSFGRGRASTP
jgi:hypothetical protein